MNILITGANGTVGRVLCDRLCDKGHSITAWDRAGWPIDDESAARQCIHTAEPAAVYHLAIASRPTGVENEHRRVNCDWPAMLARLCHQSGIRFLFTSTVMVFSNDAIGPFTIDSVPDAAEGYGYEKRLAEKAVREANRDATIVRLGWQIGDAPGSNNMIDFLDRHQRENGCVEASRKWLPACSFLCETADALIGLLDRASGLYMLDSNRGWSFFEIACALNELHGRTWRIEANDSFVYDQRMNDERTALPPLSAHLPWLKERC